MGFGHDVKNIADKKITFRYGMLVLVAVIFTWLIHEFAHWATSELLGYKATMSLNGSGLESGGYHKDWHRILTSGVGPFITLLQATGAFIFLKSGKWIKSLYPFLFTAFYMRLLAGLMNFINLNDEGRISSYFGIGTFTLPLIFSDSCFIWCTSYQRNISLTGNSRH